MKEELQIAVVAEELLNNDYTRTIIETFDILLVWKEEHGDDFLFATDLNDVEKTVVALNAQLVRFLTVAVTTCVDGLRKEHWDLILCSLVSWLQVSHVFKSTKIMRATINENIAHAYR